MDAIEKIVADGEAMDERERQYIRQQLPQELQAKYTDSDLNLLMEYIVDYFTETNVLESEGDSEGYITLDMSAIADYVCRTAQTDAQKSYDPDEVLLVVQADIDFQENEQD